jgi:hypothetical protein
MSGRHNNPAQIRLKPWGNENICMVENGHCGKTHFENQYGQRPCTEGGDNRKFEHERYQDFHRMKTQTRGRIDMKLCVVHAM